MAGLSHTRRESLSISMPDVSLQEGSRSSSMYEFTPLPSLPDSPPRTPANYNIDDDRWADKMDSATGSVFFIDPQSPSNALEGQPRSSSSCSSVSSLVSDFRVTSPTVPNIDLTERFSRSLYIPPESPKHIPPDSPSNLVHQMSAPEQIDGFHFPKSAVLSSRKTSSLKKIKRALTKKRIRTSGSLSDLNEVATEAHVHSLPNFCENESSPPPTPEATMYGSHNIPLVASHYSTRRHRGSNLARVTIDISQFGLGAAVSPCSMERLGIVPSRSLTKGKFGSTLSLMYPKSPPNVEVSEPVLIRGVVPGSPAAVLRNFYSGDTIYFVDGYPVNLDNIDNILAGVSGKVLFLVKKGHHRPPLSSQISGPSPGGLVRLVSGARSHSLPNSGPPQHCLVLYLTLDTKEDDPAGKDVLYQLPKADRETDTVAAVKGISLTLADLLREISSGATTTFCSSIVADGSLLHLAYIKYGQELLLISLPDTIATPYQTQLLVEKIACSLELLYGTVHNAMSSSTHWSLDHLMTLLIDSITHQSASSSYPSVLTVVPQLTLTTELKTRLSFFLSRLDSGDHSNRPEILHLRRPFILLGSCLFLKGSLACSHLNDSDQKNVVLLCDSYRLSELCATESVSQIVIWKQLFLTRLKLESLPYSKHGNHFILIVGLGQAFVCMLMEAVVPFEKHSPPSIDAVYVDRARSLIMELQTQDIVFECEKQALPSTPLPSVITADIALASKFTRRASLNLPPAAPSNQRKSSEPIIPSISMSRLKSSQIRDSSDEDDSKASPDLQKRTMSLLSVVRPKRRLNLSNPLKRGTSPVQSVGQPNRLTSGTENLLLHYLNLSPGRGVVLCPTDTTPGPAHSELLQTFRFTCLSIHELLVGRVKDTVESDSESDDGWSSDEDEEKPDKEPAPPFTLHASSVIEHGVLIQCGIRHSEKHKSSTTLNYWIVGRLCGEGDERKELYVCYQENMSQNCVEMAYRLLFGWTD